MTAIVAGDRYKAPYAGEDGNASSWSGYHKMTAAGSIGDTIDLFKIPAGAKIDEVIEAHSAHGGTAAMTIGWKYEDGSSGGSATALKASGSTVSAGASANPVIPNNVITGQVFDKPAIVYITNSGSAIPQNGEVYVACRGEFVGTK